MLEGFALITQRPLSDCPNRSGSRIFPCQGWVDSQQSAGSQRREFSLEFRGRWPKQRQLAVQSWRMACVLRARKHQPQGFPAPCFQPYGSTRALQEPGRCRAAGLGVGWMGLLHSNSPAPDDGGGPGKLTNQRAQFNAAKISRATTSQDSHVLFLTV